MEKMSNIPEFYVTNRSSEEVRKMVHLSQNDIENLPSGANVLEIGSGVFQNFARGLKELRPDIHIFSIDPTLGISLNDKKIFESKVIKDNQGNIDTAIYRNKNVESNAAFPEVAKNEDLSKLQSLRINEANKTENVIAALAPDIPLLENSIDLIVDVYGPGLYIQLNQGNKSLAYFKEIYRILKIGGEARIFPAIDMRRELGSRMLDDESSMEFAKIFYHQMFSINEINFDIFFEEGNEPGTQRKMLVMILKKK